MRQEVRAFDEETSSGTWRLVVIWPSLAITTHSLHRPFGSLMVLFLEDLISYLAMGSYFHHRPKPVDLHRQVGNSCGVGLFETIESYMLRRMRSFFESIYKIS